MAVLLPINQSLMLLVNCRLYSPVLKKTSQLHSCQSHNRIGAPLLDLKISGQYLFAQHPTDKI